MSGLAEILCTGNAVFAETGVLGAHTIGDRVADIDCADGSVIAKDIVWDVHTGRDRGIEGVGGTADAIIAASGADDVQTAFRDVTTVRCAIRPIVADTRIGRVGATDQ